MSKVWAIEYNKWGGWYPIYSDKLRLGDALKILADTSPAHRTRIRNTETDEVIPWEIFA